MNDVLEKASYIFGTHAGEGERRGGDLDVGDFFFLEFFASTIAKRKPLQYPSVSMKWFLYEWGLVLGI